MAIDPGTSRPPEARASTSVVNNLDSNGRITVPEVSNSWESNNKQNLLPGVPDEITINHILTKLPWGNLYLLASLGRAWRAALRSRDVHDARVRARSTQTLVAMIHDHPSHTFRNLDFSLSLYDSWFDTWHLLPRIPGIRCGIPEGCGCVSVDGKLYIIGGRGDRVSFSNEVYAFDTAGTGLWTQCASMRCGRAVFASDVKDGKIYVFGGMGAESAAEVYDPVEDRWRGIAPMLTNRIQHRVLLIGDLFFVHMGKFYSSDRLWPEAHFAEVYDVSRDLWWRFENFTGHSPMGALFVEALVVIYERIFKIFDDGLCIFNESTGSWGLLQGISWDVLKPRRPSVSTNLNAVAASVLAIQGELLALVYCQSSGSELVLTPLRSVGLGRNQVLVWKKIQSPLHFRDCHCLCAIEL